MLVFSAFSLFSLTFIIHVHHYLAFSPHNISVLCLTDHSKTLTFLKCCFICAWENDRCFQNSREGPCIVLSPALSGLPDTFTLCKEEEMKRKGQNVSSFVLMTQISHQTVRCGERDTVGLRELKGPLPFCTKSFLSPSPFTVFQSAGLLDFKKVKLNFEMHEQSGHWARSWGRLLSCTDGIWRCLLNFTLCNHQILHVEDV